MDILALQQAVSDTLIEERNYQRDRTEASAGALALVAMKLEQSLQELAMTDATAGGLGSAMAFVYRLQRDITDLGFRSSSSMEKYTSSAIADLFEATAPISVVHRISDPAVRQQVWEMTAGKCAYCDCDLEPNGVGGLSFSVEHVVPRSAGGPDHIANYVPSCATCNTSKRDVHVLDFIKRRFPGRVKAAPPALALVPISLPA